jgi:hypothetical protein
MIESGVGSVSVHTTSNRGSSPSELAEFCIQKILYISESASPEVRQQAEAYKDRIKSVILFYLEEAVKSDRVTIQNAIKSSGHPELAEYIGRL